MIVNVSEVDDVVPLSEFKALQEQVEILTRRLDFMAPKLSLLNHIGQTSQKVEAEASHQLTRLKSAKGAEDPSTPDFATVDSADLAVWLQTVTDAVLGLLNRAVPEPSASLWGSGQSRGRSKSPASYLLQANMFSPKSLREVSPRGESAVLEGIWKSVPEEKMQPKESGRARSQSPRGRQLEGPRVVPKSALKVDVVIPKSGSGAGMAARSFQSLPASKPQRDMSPAPSSHDIFKSVERRWPQTAEMETTLGREGLVLGKGAWAQAYRVSTGTRREALNMLGITGIVTERELADDLTEIGQEHIEECICIATEMLEKWPPRHGAPPVQVAKRFFEERLAQLYLRRHPPVYQSPNEAVREPKAF